MSNGAIIRGLMLLAMLSLAWADGIPYDRETGKVTVLHTIIDLTAEQEEEIAALGTLTLTEKQWEKQRKVDPGVPIRYTPLPFTYDDCTCDMGEYVILLPGGKAAVRFSHEYEDYEAQGMLEAGFRMNQHGEFFCQGASCQFATVSRLFSDEKKREQEEKNRQMNELELQKNWLAYYKKTPDPSPELKAAIKKMEKNIRDFQKKKSQPPARKPLVVRLPFGMTQKSPAIKKPLDALQALAKKEGWPALDIRVDNHRAATPDGAELVDLSENQVFEIEALGTLTLDTTQWEEIRKRHPLARKRAGFQMMSSDRAAIAKEDLKAAPDTLKKYLEKGTYQWDGDSYVLSFSVDRRGQFYSDSSLIPFQMLLDAVRETSSRKNKRGEAPCFVVTLPVGMTGKEAALKSRLDLLYEAAKKAGFEVAGD